MKTSCVSFSTEIIWMGKEEFIIGRKDHYSIDTSGLLSLILKALECIIKIIVGPPNGYL